MNSLLSKPQEGSRDHRIDWTQECQSSFEDVKTALTTAPLLGYADFREPFILEIDASHQGLGAVLSLSKAMGQKLRTAQRAMERKMLNLKIKDKIPYTEIRKRTRVQDIVHFVLKQKWKWAGHVARLDDNRWTQRVTEWQPREGRRSRGRQRKRWRDDLVQLKGVTWRHDAQHRQRWRSDVEGYFQQWRNTAL